jgi:hypothetical protein
MDIVGTGLVAGGFGYGFAGVHQDQEWKGGGISTHQTQIVAYISARGFKRNRNCSS